VSTERQKEEQTIESQVLELKKQIALSGNVLVKEYVDDGYSGTMLDRPALEELALDGGFLALPVGAHARVERGPDRRRDVRLCWVGSVGLERHTS
jgi:hypothetical protein